MFCPIYFGQTTKREISGQDNPICNKLVRNFSYFSDESFGMLHESKKKKNLTVFNKLTFRYFLI